jgi:hypothetical protein
MPHVLSLLLCLLLAYGAGGLHAATAPQVAELGNKVLHHLARADKGRSDLLDMMGAASDSDYTWASEIQWNAVSADHTATHLADLAILYGAMSVESDRQIVMVRLRAVHATVKTLLANNLVAVNRSLARLKAPALIAQGQRVRDDLRSLLDVYEAWTP